MTNIARFLLYNISLSGDFNLPIGQLGDRDSEVLWPHDPTVSSVYLSARDSPDKAPRTKIEALSSTMGHAFYLVTSPRIS